MNCFSLEQQQQKRDVHFMNVTATINIKMPSGKSPKGFPYEFTLTSCETTLGTVVFDSYFLLPENKNTNLHPGDKIIIEIL